MMTALGASTVATLRDARQKAPQPHSRGASHRRSSSRGERRVNDRGASP
ncbi:hypothetical protein [Paenibacillus sp. FSL H8-0283]